MDWTAAWASDRGLTFSDSNLAALMGSQPEHTEGDPPSLTIAGITLEWADDTFRLLGTHLSTYKAHTRATYVSKLDTQSLAKCLLDTEQILAGPNGVCGTSITVIRHLLQTTFYAKALYPTAVADVDYGRVDSMAMGFIRRVLHLPKTTPSALLFCEFRLAPSEVQGLRRALRFFASLIVHSWWIRNVVMWLIDRNMTPALNQLFSCGPMLRLHEYLVAHRETLIPAEHRLPSYEQNPYLVWREASSFLDDGAGLSEWRLAVEKVYDSQFDLWLTTRLNDHDYVAVLKPHLIDSLCLPVSDTPWLPDYTRFTTRYASTALRHKIPGLRFQHFHREPLPVCRWCKAPSSETSMHLLFCPRQPPGIHAQVMSTLDLICQEACAPDDHVKGYCASLIWPHMTSKTLNTLLTLIYHTIEHYRSSCNPTGVWSSHGGVYGSFANMEEPADDAIDVFSSMILPVHRPGSH